MLTDGQPRAVFFCLVLVVMVLVMFDGTNAPNPMHMLLPYWT